MCFYSTCFEWKPDAFRSEEVKDCFKYRLSFLRSFVTNLCISEAFISNTFLIFQSWVLCRVGSTGRPIKLFLNNVPRGCKRLPEEKGPSNRYEISNYHDGKVLSNIMKDQPMINSAGGSMRARKESSFSEWHKLSRFSTFFAGMFASIYAFHSRIQRVSIQL